MDFSRRIFMSSATGLAAAGLTAMPARAAMSSAIITATDLGIEPDSMRDQSAALQNAFDIATERNAALMLPPGTYRASGLRIARPLHLLGLAGRSQLAAVRDEPILDIADVPFAASDGLGFDGKDAHRSREVSLVTAGNCADLRITDCTFSASANGVSARGSGGRIQGNHIRDIRKTGIFLLDSTGFDVSGNDIADIGNNAIQVWSSSQRRDGTMVTRNRIARVRFDDGGNGQNGNGVVVFRSGDVLVADNSISGCDFSAVRNNSGANAVISGNICSGLRETAIYAEFAFEGAIISNNIIDMSATGIAITNFDSGGRLAVCSGNLVRNLRGAQSNPDTRGIGIAAEADTVVTGNVIENVPYAGIHLGWGPYCRNLSATNNILRDCPIGIAASAVKDAGKILIANNMIAGSTKGAILGMDHSKILTQDLTELRAETPENIVVTGNVRS